MAKRGRRNRYTASSDQVKSQPHRQARVARPVFAQGEKSYLPPQMLPVVSHEQEMALAVTELNPLQEAIAEMRARISEAEENMRRSLEAQQILKNEMDEVSQMAAAAEEELAEAAKKAAYLKYEAEKVCTEGQALQQQLSEEEEYWQSRLREESKLLKDVEQKLQIATEESQRISHAKEVAARMNEREMWRLGSSKQGLWLQRRKVQGNALPMTRGKTGSWQMPRVTPSPGATYAQSLLDLEQKLQDDYDPNGAERLDMLSDSAQALADRQSMQLEDDFLIQLAAREAARRLVAEKERIIAGEASPVMETAAEPLLEPMPVPVTEAASESMPEPVIAAVAKPMPEPIPKPAVEVIPEPMQEPVAEVIPEQRPEPMIAAVAEPMPEPIPKPAVEVIPEPMPEPVAEVIPGPMPEPVAEVIPGPKLAPVIEAILEPMPEPIPKPVAEVISEPKLAQVIELVRPPMTEPEIGKVPPAPALNVEVLDALHRLETPFAMPVASPVAAPLPYTPEEEEAVIAEAEKLPVDEDPLQFLAMRAAAHAQALPTPVIADPPPLPPLTVMPINDEDMNRLTRQANLLAQQHLTMQQPTPAPLDEQVRDRAKIVQKVAEETGRQDHLLKEQQTAEMAIAAAMAAARKAAQSAMAISEQVNQQIPSLDSRGLAEDDRPYSVERVIADALSKAAVADQYRR